MISGKDRQLLVTVSQQPLAGEVDCEDLEMEDLQWEHKRLAKKVQGLEDQLEKVTQTKRALTKAR